MEELTEDVLRFITTRIDTVPELEALLLFWEQRPTALTVKQLARMLYVPRGVAAAVVRSLLRRKFIASVPGDSRYVYDPAWDPDGELIARIAAAYRRHLIRVTRLIHSKAPTAVLEFARAFEPTKDT
jgi:hypothetical protein